MNLEKGKELSLYADDTLIYISNAELSFFHLENEDDFLEQINLLKGTMIVITGDLLIHHIKHFNKTTEK